MSTFSTAARLQASILSVIAALLIASATAAWPEVYVNDPNSRDPNRAAIVATGNDLAPIAKEFGCEFAWGQLNDASSASLEYVPKGDDVRTWTRLVTITTVNLPADVQAQAQLMKRLHTIALSGFSGRGSVRAQKTGENPKGLPALYFEYEIGEGAQKEFGAVGVYKVRPDIAAIVQIQSHKALAREDATKMSALAIPVAKN
jgi:hypothetical protein